MEWSDIKGEFDDIETNATNSRIGTWMYLYMVHLKDEKRDVESDPPVDIYETLSQALNPLKKTDEEKYTWHGVKMVPVLKDGKPQKVKNRIVKESKEGDWPVSKYITVSGEVKMLVTFMLTRYLHEILKMYESDGFEEDLFDQIKTYSNDYMEPSFAAHVIQITDAVDVEGYVSNNSFNSDKYGGNTLNTFIYNKLVPYFKKGNNAPNDELAAIVSRFVDFIKVITIYASNNCWVKRGSFNVDLLLISLRNSYIGTDCKYSIEMEQYMQEFLSHIKQQVAEAKLKRAAEKKAKEEAESEVALEEEDQETEDQETKPLVDAELDDDDGDFDEVSDE